jgi:hypothetical protein
VCNLCLSSKTDPDAILKWRNARNCPLNCGSKEQSRWKETASLVNQPYQTKTSKTNITHALECLLVSVSRRIKVHQFTYEGSSYMFVHLSPLLNGWQPTLIDFKMKEEYLSKDIWTVPYKVMLTVRDRGSLGAIERFFAGFLRIFCGFLWVPSGYL